MSPKRNRKDPIILGVCSGLAKEYNKDVFLIRLATVIITVLTGFLAGIIAYIILAIIMD